MSEALVAAVQSAALVGVVMAHRYLSSAAERQVLAAVVGRGADQMLPLVIRMAADLEVVVDHTPSVEVGYHVLDAVLRHVDGRRLPAEAESRDVSVDSPIWAGPGLHTEAESHSLVVVVGRGLTAHVAGQSLFAVTECHSMMAGIVAGVGAGKSAVRAFDQSRTRKIENRKMADEAASVMEDSRAVELERCSKGPSVGSQIRCAASVMEHSHAVELERCSKGPSVGSQIRCAASVMEHSHPVELERYWKGQSVGSKLRHAASMMEDGRAVELGRCSRGPSVGSRIQYAASKKVWQCR